MYKKIKIVLVVDVLRDIAGGAERQVYELLKHLNREKFEALLFVLHQKGITNEVSMLAGLRVSGLGIRRIYDFRGIREGFKFAKFLKREKIDILMTYHFSSDIWGTVFGRLAGVPVIISNRRDEGFWRKAIHIRAYKLINRWVTKVIVVSNSVKRMVIAQERVGEDKICVIYNGVELERFNAKIDIASKKKELGLPLNSRVIACVGNLRAIKGQRYLIEASAGIIAKFQDVHFIFIGEGELRAEFEKLARKSGLQNNLHFLGKRDDVPELLKIADICVLPSLSEGLSNALLEYMAAGKPVVATSAGGTPEVIENNKNGVLIPPYNSQILAKKIMRLLENRQFALNLGARAEETVCERFALSGQIRIVEEFLEKTLEDKKGIRIMHLISSGGLFGAEKVMLSLASNMNWDGVKSRVVAVKNCRNIHLEVIDEARKRNIPNGVIESKGRLDLKSISQLVNIIKQNNISLVHSHNYKADFIGLLAAKIARIPIVATNHLWNGGDIRVKLYEFLDGIILGCFADKIIAVSNSIKKDMLKRGIPDSKIEVIFNGIEAEKSEQEPLNNGFGINEGTTVIGVVARLSQEKGHRFLLEGMREILRHKPNINLLIIGEGALEGELKKQAEGLGISKETIFAGYQDDMHRIYPLIDILVQPSLKEGLPMALLEAMAFGKAIVATNVGGVGALIKDRYTGLLINPASSEEICNAVSSLIDDANLRKRLGENASQFVKENYSLEKMLASYRKVYEDTICYAKTALTC